MIFEAKNRINHFLRNVEKSPKCWIWKGCKQPNGYGVYGMNYKVFRAHRASYLLFVGKIPKGKLILHSCDNRLCVNPKHLRIGTHKDNSLDAIARGRQVRGVKHGKSKFNDAYILYLIKKYDGKKGSMKKLAKSEGLHPATLGKILRKERWKHV